MRLAKNNMESKINQKRAQESLSSLASMLRASQDQDIIQINNDTIPLCWQRNSMGLVSEVKTLGATASSNGKSFH